MAKADAALQALEEKLIERGRALERSRVEDALSRRLDAAKASGERYGDTEFSKEVRGLEMALILLSELQ